MIKMKTKNIGINIPAPKDNCEDKNCPFHGNINVKGRTFIGTVIKKDLHKSATVEWSYYKQIPKYERKERRLSKVHVHNPKCINAEIGDMVKIMQTRPISKTKNFVIIQNLGKEKGFSEKMLGREEAKAKEVREEKETDNTPKETQDTKVKE